MIQLQVTVIKSAPLAISYALFTNLLFIYCSTLVGRLEEHILTNTTVQPYQIVLAIQSMMSDKNE